MRKPRKTVKGPVRAAGSAGGSTGAAGRGAKGGGKRGIGPGKARGIKPQRHPHGTVKGTAGPKGGSTGPAGKSAPKKKPAKTVTPKKRQYSPGSDVACCAAEALGTLVITSGSPWSHEETLALYWSTASDPGAGATILETLEAARRRCRPERFELSWAGCDQPLHRGGCNPRENPLWPLRARLGSAFILGVSLPEPHAVAVTPDGRWWSWGEPFSPGDWPDMIIDEAWAVLL